MLAFLAELKRRNVFRVAGVYLAASWLLVQVAGTFVQIFELPTGGVRFMIVLLALAFPVAVVCSWLYELTPEGVKLTRNVTPDESARPIGGRKLDRVLIGVLAALVAALLLESVVFRNLSIDGTPDPSGTPRIAVLPFENVSGDAGQEHLADGISEEILNSLDRLKGLAVIGRASSFYFKGRNESPRAIGEQLDARHLLTGTVRKDGADLRVSAELIDAPTGSRVWRETYVRSVEGVFTVEDQIARSVAEELEVTLGVGDLDRVAGMTRSFAAYDNYLAGNAILNKPLPNTAEAAERFQKALDLDPTFAVAQSRLYYAHLIGFVIDARPGQARPRELLDERDAVLDLMGNLDADSPDYHIMAADDAVDRYDWAGAERELERARDAARESGSVADIDEWEGGFRMVTGRFKDAIPSLERAKRRDPLNITVAQRLSVAYAISGDVSAALAEVERGKQLDGAPQFWEVLSMIAADAGDTEVLRQQIDLFVDDSRGRFSEIHAAIRPVLDQPDQALTALHGLVEQSPTAVETVVIATYAGHFGDPDWTLELLSFDSFRHFGGLLPSTFWGPAFREARKLPAFKQLVRQLGFVDYWRELGWTDLCRPVGANDFDCA